MGLNQAIGLIERGEVDKAGVILVNYYLKYKGNKNKPNDYVYYQYNLARVYESKKQYAKAELLLKEILQENQENYGAYFLLGKIYEKWMHKDNHLRLAKVAFSRIPKSAPNYRSAKKYLDNIESQLEAVRRLEEYEVKPTEYFDDQKIAHLGLLVNDIKGIEICSNRDEYYFRVSQIVANIKNTSFRKKREEGKKISEIYQSSELNVLEKVINLYLQEAGFDV